MIKRAHSVVIGKVGVNGCLAKLNIVLVSGCVVINVWHISSSGNVLRGDYSATLASTEGVIVHTLA
jgi:hypothetical protein